MLLLNTLKIHRKWQDFCLLGIGVLTVLSPLIDTQALTALTLLNALVVGFVVMLLAALELAVVERWEERTQFAMGIWLAVSPLLFGYGGNLAACHVVFGLSIAAIAALELWQDHDKMRDA